LGELTVFAMQKSNGSSLEKLRFTVAPSRSASATTSFWCVQGTAVRGGRRSGGGRAATTVARREEDVGTERCGHRVVDEGHARATTDPYLLFLDEPGDDEDGAHGDVSPARCHG
jgi:hypothetical protein